MEHSNKQTMLIPLLEDIDGIDNAEEIFAQLKPGRRRRRGREGRPDATPADQTRDKR